MANLPSIALALLTTLSQGASPRVLIYDDTFKIKADEGKIVELADYVAQQFSDDQRLFPIVWSLTDQVFREAALANKFKEVPDHPNLRQAQDAARALNCDGILVIQAVQKDGKLAVKGILYRNGRSAWKEDDSQSVTVGGKFSETGTYKAAANTMVVKLAAEAYPKVKPTVAAVNQPPDQGLQPKPPTTPNQQPPRNNTAVIDEANRLRTQKLYPRALSLVRDAIDSDPGSKELRTLLITLYFENSEPLLAAQEARRAARIFPTDGIFWVESARGWMAAGRPDEARNDLNEAISRDPTSGPVRELLAEAAIGEGKFDIAIDNLNAIPADKKTDRDKGDLAICHALQGKLDQAKDELTPAAVAALPYSLVSSATIAGVTKISDTLKALHQQAALDPGSNSVEKGLNDVTNLISSLKLLLPQATPPENHKKAHDRRLLALNLLAQSIEGLRDFRVTRSEDALADSRIDLGEALKQMAAAKVEEQQG